MNKKILILAFISAAVFFGCSADGTFNPKASIPDWEGIPSAEPPSGGGGGGGGGGGSGSSKYCVFEERDDCWCSQIPNGYTDNDCRNRDGYPSNSCPNYCDIDD